MTIWNFPTPLSGCQDRYISWGWHSASQKITGAADEENACAQVCDDIDLYFIVCEFIMYSDDLSVCRKPSSVDPSKKITKPATSSNSTLVVPSVGVTASTTLSAAETWDYCRWTTEFLEGLKNKESDQEGNPFTPLLFLSFDLFWLTYGLLDLQCSPMSWR
jgi:hypothetical protein